MAVLEKGVAIFLSPEHKEDARKQPLVLLFLDLELLSRLFGISFALKTVNTPFSRLNFSCIDL